VLPEELLRSLDGQRPSARLSAARLTCGQQPHGSRYDAALQAQRERRLFFSYSSPRRILSILPLDSHGLRAITVPNFSEHRLNSQVPELTATAVEVTEVAEFCSKLSGSQTVPAFQQLVTRWHRDARG
jgi:hypothetical protein